MSHEESDLGMVRLSSGNLQKLQDCIRALYSELDASSFPHHVIRVASQVIPSGVTSYAAISHQKQKLSYAGQASCRAWEKLDGFVRHMDEHPILNYLHSGLLKPHRLGEDIEKAVQKRFPSLRQAQHTTAVRVSDALTDRQFRSLGVYNDFFRKNDVHYQMLISFLPTRSGYAMISFNRDKKDFSEEERLILNLFAPHIEQAYQNAEAHKKAQQAFARVAGPKQPLTSCGLTEREADVLYWVAQGKTNAEAAGILNIAPGTVKVHLERIYQKLGVENRTAAARLAAGIKCDKRTDLRQSTNR